ncbi:ricin-type beta-trefoil lectin domain protein [Streptomyces chattanoogensis]|uniref:RICIN domain-containing protein n=1 Tax=Streptomyces chattanoogensis TaxID=66876 RepID=UPI0036746290
MVASSTRFGGRTAAVTAALVMGAFSLGVVNPSSAHAGTQDVVNTFRNQSSGDCLDVFGVRYGPTTVPCNGNVEQNWNVHVWADNTRELKSLSNGECLDDSDAYGLRIYPCNASPWQSWYVHRWNDGTIELKNQATGRCLGEGDTGLWTYPCSSSPYQSWY